MSHEEHDRIGLIERLRVEALEDCRAHGCTCEPKMELTEKGYGPHDLPMWISDHAEDCGISRQIEQGDGALARKMSADGKALMLGKSAIRRLWGE